MANILDTPRIARQVEALRVNCPEMVPVDCDTSFIQIAYPDDVVDEFPPSSLSVRAYVVGLELLGYRLSVVDDTRSHSVCIGEPEHTLPPVWSRRSLALFQSFGRRTDEVIAFLLERDGGPTLVRATVSAS